MRRFVISVASLAVMSVTVSGQPGDELARLREGINAPASTVIVSSRAAQLPAVNTLKVYLVIGKDGKADGRIARWIDKWNQNEGQRFGRLQVVSDLSQADVVMARHVVRGDVSVQRRTSIGVVPARNPGTDRISAGPTVASGQYLHRPLYSYLLVRTPDALAIVYRHIDRGHPNDRADPDGRLIDELKKKMKAS